MNMEELKSRGGNELGVGKGWRTLSDDVILLSAGV